MGKEGESTDWGSVEKVSHGYGIWLVIFIPTTYASRDSIPCTCSCPFVSGESSTAAGFRLKVL